MDPSCYKRYHVHGFDSRQFLDHYFSDKPEMVLKDETLKFPIEQLAKTLADGHIKGDILIDISKGPIVHHLYAACEYFNHIIVLKFSDRCIMELKRWLHSRTGAFDWGHATRLHVASQGNGDQLQDKEENVRSTVRHVVRCDLEKENMTHPIVLPAADCIISAWILDLVCKDQDDFIRYLKKFSGLLKPGGHLILIGSLDMTYFTVGKDKFHGFRYDAEFARNVLEREGFVIDTFEIKKRTAVSDLTNFNAVMFIAAHKK